MASDWRENISISLFSPTSRSCECFFLSRGPAHLLKSVSNVCRVMKWYPPREMTSPNDKQNGRKFNQTLHFQQYRTEKAMKPWHFKWSWHTNCTSRASLHRCPQWNHVQSVFNLLQHPGYQRWIRITGRRHWQYFHTSFDLLIVEESIN